MQFSLKHLALAAIAGGALTLASCGEDDEVIVPNRAPTITLNGAAAGGRIDSLPSASVNAVEITTADADGNLNTVSFLRNGTSVVASSGNVRSDATTPIAANPILLFDGDRSGFTRTYFLRTPPDAGDSVTYTITVEDEDGLTASEEVTLVNALPLTRIERTLEGILLNQAGPAGQGGLDLDLGEGTGSQDTLAEIRDRGIDQNRPNASNWLQQIAPVGDAVLRIPSTAFLTENNITFESVQFVEEIIGAYNSSSVDEPRTNELSGGEVFVVFDNDRYYMIQIRSVNVTTDNNQDSYVIDIKY